MCEHLKKIQYEILETNWRFSSCEIDIIAKDKNELVVVEVKFRKKKALVRGAEAVNQGKQKRLIKAASAYIAQQAIEMECRFDVIEVIEENIGLRLNHIVSAFYPLAQ